MSESVSIGTVACAGIAAAVVAGGKACIAIKQAIDKALHQMDQRAQERLIRLVEFAEARQPALATAGAALESLNHTAQKLHRSIRTEFPEIPSEQAKTFARLIALNQSPLRDFVKVDKFTKLISGKGMNADYDRAIRQAADQMNLAMFKTTKEIIRKTAAKLEFTDDFREFEKGNRHYLAFIDREGHGLVAEVRRTEEDVQLKLDLTGYGDGQCHVVMDKLLEEMSKKGLVLHQVRRLSHYSRKGIWQNWFRESNKEKAGTQSNRSKAFNELNSARENTIAERKKAHCKKNIKSRSVY